MTGDRPCPRCRTGSVLAVLRLPHTWTNAAGNEVRGVSEVLLCARCDAGDPAAGPIVTYFAVHGSVRPEHAAQLARGLRHWAERARPPRPDESALAAETEAWYRGDL
ncbi:DUF6300 family protein [Nonomuraea angiospora]|uniref:DUF6300 family protein n=1 Tax=Nonomuraea angiospora TaxID=46172 RepID=UPI0029BAE758|nr:DUF6300 family protein [Nonomuraea angiospora]MDX3100563.1 DUF6300 family protein [Nonomuraea angiospora]